jgi:hypothetical protein
MSKKALVPVNVLSSRNSPTGQYSGDVYFNENTQSLFIYNGGSWIEFIPTVASENGGSPTSTYTGLQVDGGIPGPQTFEYTYDGGTFQ